MFRNLDVNLYVQWMHIKKTIAKKEEKQQANVGYIVRSFDFYCNIFDGINLQFFHDARAK